MVRESGYPGCHLGRKGGRNPETHFNLPHLCPTGKTHFLLSAKERVLTNSRLDSGSNPDCDSWSN